MVDGVFSGSPWCKLRPHTRDIAPPDREASLHVSGAKIASPKGSVC